MSFSEFYYYWLGMMGVIALGFFYIIYAAEKKSSKNPRKRK